MTKENTRTPLLLTICEEISLEMQPHPWHVKILRHACYIRLCPVLVQSVFLFSGFFQKWINEPKDIKQKHKADRSMKRSENGKKAI